MNSCMFSGARTERGSGWLSLQREEMIIWKKESSRFMAESSNPLSCRTGFRDGDHYRPIEK